MLGRRWLIAAGVVVAAVAVGGVAGAIIGSAGPVGVQSTPVSSTQTAGPTARDTRSQPRPPPASWARRGSARRRGQGARTSPTAQLLDKLSDGKTTIADVAKQQSVDVQTR